MQWGQREAAAAATALFLRPLVPFPVCVSLAHPPKLPTHAHANTPDYKRTTASTAGAPPADAAAALRAAHARGAARLRDLCHANGGVYVKLGQHVATLVSGERKGRVDHHTHTHTHRIRSPSHTLSFPPTQNQQDHLLPPEYVNLMKATMLNAVPPAPFADVRATVEEDLQAPLSSTFLSFDPTPIAAASLAQVHRAVVVDGTSVAVKVQHRGLREACAADIATVAGLVAAGGLLFPGFDLSWLVAEIKANLPRELDFRLEAENAERCASNLEAPSSSVRGRVVVPHSHPPLPPTPRVHVMEWIDGVPAADPQALATIGASPRTVATLIATAFSEMIFIHGFVHADPHPGNLLVRRGRDGKAQLVLLDHGLYRE